jgi:hypothetical protein
LRGKGESHLPAQVKCEAHEEGSPWNFPAGNYYVNLLSKTLTILPGESEMGFDVRSMFPGLRVTEVIHEEPDPHLFLITGDLKETKPDATVC